MAPRLMIRFHLLLHFLGKAQKWQLSGAGNDMLSELEAAANVSYWQDHWQQYTQHLCIFQREAAPDVKGKDNDLHITPKHRLHV